MWLFGSDGCGGHHFGEYTYQNEWEITIDWYEKVHGVQGETCVKPTQKYVIKRKQESTCKHDGCSETDTRWTTVAEFDEPSDIEEMIDEYRDDDTNE